MAERTRRRLNVTYDPTVSYSSFRMYSSSIALFMPGGGLNHKAGSVSGCTATTTTTTTAGFEDPSVLARSRTTTSHRLRMIIYT
jgi:hypothetical protein